MPFQFMNLQQATITVLMGGPSSEREVSLATGRAVADALRQAGVAAVHELDVKGPDFELPEGTDLAFNCLHGTFGEDGQVQAILRDKGVIGTGAGERASRLAFDKLASKEVFADAGVPTPEFVIVQPEDITELPPLPVPLVVKPTREGSSVGVHIVHAPEEWLPAARETARHGCPLLVEAFVEGRELTVGILGGVALPIIEIRPRSGFYDMANKYPWMSGGATADLGSDYLCPAPLDDELTGRVQDAALAANRALGIEVLSRVDVLLDADGNPWVLEANTIPGMTETSLLPKAAAAAGISFSGLCQRIAALSWQAREV